MYGYGVVKNGHSRFSIQRKSPEIPAEVNVQLDTLVRATVARCGTVVLLAILHIQWPLRGAYICYKFD